MQNAILKYCQENGITMDEMSKITKVSVPQLYLINSNPGYNVKIITVNKIFVGTKRKFGVGFFPYKYLDQECFARTVLCK